MLQVVATEKTFVSRLLAGLETIPMLSQRFGMIAEEVTEVLSDNSRSEQELRAFAALLQSRQIIGLLPSELVCSVKESLIALKPEYLALGVCCNKKLVIKQPVPQSDADVFDLNGVQIFDSPAAAFRDAGIAGNIVKSWHLTERGVLKVEDVFRDPLLNARKVKIYDRYFTITSLECLEDVLLSIVASEQCLIPFDLDIYNGQGHVSAPSGMIVSRLKNYFVSSHQLRVHRSDRRVGEQHLHDRYVQIDERTTIILTSGMAAFKESGGKNRASSVFQADLYLSSSAAKIIELRTNREIEFRW